MSADDHARYPVDYLVLPGAGSAGAPGRHAAKQLEAVVHPVPDEPDGCPMAESVEPAVAAMRGPRVIVGTSLGAMVSLEFARRIEVDALVLIAAGFGITVAESVLDLGASNPPDLLEKTVLEKTALTGLADSSNRELAAISLADFRSRGLVVLLNHLRALAGYRPEPLEPASTFVLSGERHGGVPLADHAELAIRLPGVLVPIKGAGHRSSSARLRGRPDPHLRSGCAQA